MHTGYVLGFSNRTFENFFADFEVEIYSEKYNQGSGSKANYLRGFWKIETDQLVGQTILGMNSRSSLGLGPTNMVFLPDSLAVGMNTF